MDDDLDTFFAKKKAKKPKSSNLNSMDALHKKLEKTVQQQELTDKLMEEEENKGKENEPQTNEKKEESEWIEFEPPQDVDLDSLEITQMNINDVQYVVSEDEDKEPEQRKTWNLGQPDKDAVDSDGEPKESSPDAPEPIVTEKPKVIAEEKSSYVPPHLRQGAAGAAPRSCWGAASVKAPDVTSEEMFPSLADAGKIELQKEETEKKKKKQQLNDTIMPQHQQSVGEDDGFTTVGSSGKHRSGDAPPPTNPNAYVPPHLRNK